MAVQYFDGPARARLGTGFIKTLDIVFGSLGRAKAAERTFSRLATLSDAELDRRNMKSEDINQIVIQQLLGIR